jgi:hypothetical protein
MILDSAVISTHLTQPIDSPGISEETLITNKVTAISSDTPDKSMDYAMHALPTAESRMIGVSQKVENLVLSSSFKNPLLTSGEGCGFFSRVNRSE